MTAWEWPAPQTLGVSRLGLWGIGLGCQISTCNKINLLFYRELLVLQLSASAGKAKNYLMVWLWLSTWRSASWIWEVTFGNFMAKWWSHWHNQQKRFPVVDPSKPWRFHAFAFDPWVEGVVYGRKTADFEVWSFQKFVLRAPSDREWSPVWMALITAWLRLPVWKSRWTIDKTMQRRVQCVANEAWNQLVWHRVPCPRKVTSNLFPGCTVLVCPYQAWLTLQSVFDRLSRCLQELVHTPLAPDHTSLGLLRGDSSSAT